MTPNELSVHAEVYREKQKTDQDDRLSLVWLGEYYHRIEKLPPLKEVLGIEEPKKEMTPEQMLLNVEQLNAMFGGEVIH